MSQHRTYPVMRLVRLISNYYPWVAASNDAGAWKAIYYIYWMYERSLSLPSDAHYDQAASPLCRIIHTKNIVCDNVGLKTFLERFRSLWPRQSSVVMAESWGLCNDLIQTEDASTIRAAKIQYMVGYIMDLFTVVKSFLEVLEQMSMTRMDLWSRLKKVKSIRLLAMIIQSIRTLDAEVFITEEEGDKLNFEWTLCAAVIRHHCDRAKTEHTNWSSPTSVEAALIRRYNTEAKARLIDQIFRGVTGQLHCPLVGADPCVEPLSTEEWLNANRVASLVENVANGTIYLWIRGENTVFYMDSQGKIEEWKECVTEERAFLHLAGPYARAYCLD